MLEPKQILIDNSPYILSKFPAVAGREIISKYPLSSMPKLGDYKTNEETMLKLMAYVAVEKDGQKIMLSHKALVDCHVKSWETLAKIEVAMLEYNCSFFQNGRITSFLEDILAKLPAWISKILTGLSAQSSQAEKPPSMN